MYSILKEKWLIFGDGCYTNFEFPWGRVSRLMFTGKVQVNVAEDTSSSLLLLTIYYNFLWVQSLSFGFFVILTLVLGKRKFQVKSNKFSWKNSNKAGWVVDEESVCCWNCFFVSLSSVNIAVTCLWWESSNITSHFLLHRYDKLFLSWESWSVLMRAFSNEQLCFFL